MADHATPYSPAGVQGAGRFLERLVEGSFVLTDGEGTVTRWSGRAEALFGWSPAVAVGRPLLDTLVVTGEQPPVAGELETSVRHRDGREFPVSLFFVPVPMSRSLEFMAFLENLASGRPPDAIRQRIEAHNRDVIDWIEGVASGAIDDTGEEMVAGAIVVFQPLVEATWVSAADAPPVEASLADEVPSPGVSLEQTLALQQQVDEALAAAQEARARADEAEQAAAGLREELTGAGAELTSAHQGLEALRNDVARVHEELSRLQERSSAGEDVRREVGQVGREVRSTLVEVTAELEGLRGRVVGAEGMRREIDELRHMHGVLREQAGEAAAQGAEAQAASAILESMHALGDEMRAGLAAVREEAGHAAQAASAAREAADVAAGAARAAEAAIATGEAVTQSASEAAQRASASADEAAVEAKVARVQAEAARVHAEESGGRTRPAATVGAPARKAAQEEAPAREPRSGFDDVEHPMAVIGLDGRFCELNPAFCDLVGYTEQDFRSAAWPPVTDRKNLPKHRDELRTLLAGELDSVEVNTGYMHAHGLVVPVVGTLRLVRDDQGEPAHLVLESRAPAHV